MTVLYACLIACGVLLAALLYGCYRLGRAIEHTAEAKDSYLAAAESYRQAEDRLASADGHRGEGQRPRLELVRRRTGD